MSNLVVIGFPKVEEAEQVRLEMVAIQEEHLITLEDAVVLENGAPVIGGPASARTSQPVPTWQDCDKGAGNLLIRESTACCWSKSVANVQPLSSMRLAKRPR